MTGSAGTTVQAQVAAPEQGDRRKLLRTPYDDLQQLLYAAQLKLKLAQAEHAAGRILNAARQIVEAERLLAGCTIFLSRLPQPTRVSD